MDILQNIAQRLQVWYTNRSDLWTLDYNQIPRQETLVYHAPDENDTRLEETGRACPSLADPEAYYSATLDAIYQLSRARDYLPPDFWLEFLIAAMRHNSSSMLRSLLLSWLPNTGASSELFEEGLRMGYGPHTLLLQECERRHIRIGSGKCPRCQWSMGRAENWPDQRRGPAVTRQLQHEIRTMRAILRDANLDFPHHAIVERVEQIPYVGPVKALAFYTLAVHAGFLTSAHAIRESHNAVLHVGNPGARELREAGFGDLDMALDWLAWQLDRSKKVIENSLCKMYRHPNFSWDFIADNQQLYCYRRVTNQHQHERTVFYRRSVHGPWEEYTPHLPGF